MYCIFTALVVSSHLYYEALFPCLGSGTGSSSFSLLGNYYFLSWWLPCFSPEKLSCTHFIQYSRNSLSKHVLFPRWAQPILLDGIFPGNVTLQGRQAGTALCHPSGTQKTPPCWFLHPWSWSACQPVPSSAPSLSDTTAFHAASLLN